MQNLYGKPCYELSGTIFVQGACDDAGRCKGEQYMGQDGKLHKIDDLETNKAYQDLMDAHKNGDTDAIRQAEDTIKTLKEESGYYKSQQTLTELGEKLEQAELSGDDAATARAKEEFDQALRVYESAYGRFIYNDGELQHFGFRTPTTGDIIPDPSTPSVPPTAPPAPPATGGGQSSGNTPGYTPSGSANTPRSTLTPSPQLGSSPFNLGSLFGGGGGGGGGSPSGGTIAYAPQGDPGYYNRNFESVDAQITFPKAQPSPGDILARLAQNTRRQRSEVMADSLEGRGILNSGVLTALNNIVSPVGDFVRSVFSPEASQSSFSVTDEALFIERQNLPPLERGHLVLNLAADDSLVPGDPTTIANIVEWDTLESIPSSNRAWVENAPRAADEIEGIGSAPLSYGWGEAPQSAGDAEVEAPQVSDVSYNPFLLPRGLIPEIGEDEGASEPPRSFFSVMGRSFRTITDAIGNLFKNIGKSLFWWL